MDSQHILLHKVLLENSNIVIYQMFDRRLLERLAHTLSATRPSESVLPIQLRPDFSVVFEGYAGGAVNRPTPQRAHTRSLRADILRTS